MKPTLDGNIQKALKLKYSKYSLHVYNLVSKDQGQSKEYEGIQG